jgi:hypothetical protein
VHDHVTGERGGVCHDDMVANQAVVGHMRLSHQKTIVADSGDATAAFGAAVNGDKIPNDIAMANDCLSVFPQTSDPAAAIQSTRTDRYAFHRRYSSAINHTMRIDANAITQLDLVANDHVWTDETFASQTGARTDDGGRMNHTGLQLRRWRTHGGGLFPIGDHVVNSASAQS